MRKEIAEEFVALVEAVARLRGPGGCPWDREQTHDSLKKYAIEETYETIEAIESGDPARIEDELGDLMLQVLLHARIADESRLFDIADVCRTLREKLQRRHPHVFGEVEVSGVDEVLTNWERIKLCEPGYDERKSVLDGVPASLPALMRAQKISKKAARTGFDWPNVEAVIDKLREETAELEEAMERGSKAELKEELGDLLFTVVNVARRCDIDAEEALRHMLAKFSERFGRIEQAAQERGLEVHQMSLEEMDRVWDDAKRGTDE